MPTSPRSPNGWACHSSARGRWRTARTIGRRLNDTTGSGRHDAQPRSAAMSHTEDCLHCFIMAEVARRLAAGVPGVRIIHDIVDVLANIIASLPPADRQTAMEVVPARLEHRVRSDVATFA